MRRTMYATILLLLSTLLLLPDDASSRRLGAQPPPRHTVTTTTTTTNHNVTNLTSTIPPYETTIELLTLSSLIYKYRGLSSCRDIVSRNNSVSTEYPLPPDSTCHLYERDGQDTQVLIVSRPYLTPTAGSAAGRGLEGSEGSSDGSGNSVDVSTGYVAVVYAGTDDFRNVLTDGNILMKSFGSTSGSNGTNNPYVPKSHPDIQVHAGFDHAVFHDGLFDRVLDTVLSILAVHPNYQVLTTGHSLGAADSVLTAVALHQRLGHDVVPPSSSSSPSSIPRPQGPILSVNFGCPRTGNRPWRTYVNSLLLRGSLSIYRFVNSVDIVPRLPDGRFVHVGHTVQMSSSKGCTAYYLHDGDVELGLAGVPFGWEVAPFVVVPYNAVCHLVRRYRTYLVDRAGLDRGAFYVQDFAKIGEGPDDDGDDAVVPDDDDVPDPPDDDLRFSEYETEGGGGGDGRMDVNDYRRVRAEIAGNALDWYVDWVRGGGEDGDGLLHLDEGVESASGREEAEASLLLDAFKSFAEAVA